jgi:hypothetical protein
MKLAEEIWITIGGKEIALRPTLFNAVQLERRPGSFRQLMKEIDEGSFTAALACIEPNTNGMKLINRAHILSAEVKPALIAYVIACTGLGLDNEHSEKAESTSSKPAQTQTVTIGQHLAQLYRYGTGWLGWTPEETFAATPAEIIEAYNGKLEMLKALYGAPDKAAPADNRPLSEKFRGIFASRTSKKDEAP